MIIKTKRDLFRLPVGSELVRIEEDGKPCNVRFKVAGRTGRKLVLWQAGTNVSVWTLRLHPVGWRLKPDLEAKQIAIDLHGEILARYKYS